MQTSLPLVLELHHPAMRPRHWKQLMKVRYDFSSIMSKQTAMPALLLCPAPNLRSVESSAVGFVASRQ